MDIFFDNKNIKDYGITCLDYTDALSFASERTNEITWADKSGVDKNLVNIKYEPKEFYLRCIVSASNEVAAYNNIKVLVDDMFSRGAVVLSLRDSSKGIRECFLVERSKTLTGDINVRQQNSIYYFKLGLRDLNPNAVKYKTSIEDSSVEIEYLKGQVAVIYWGNGDRSEVSNSGLYEKTDYEADGDVDIIIDIDSNSANVAYLLADFESDLGSNIGIVPETVQFTDLSEGDIFLWSWDFGDGETSSEQNPSHIYSSSGTFSVSLQVFNSAKGSDFETKTGYVNIRNARMLVNDSGDLALVNDSGDLGLIN